MEFPSCTLLSIPDYKNNILKRGESNMERGEISELPALPASLVEEGDLTSSFG